jgi:hypothetical protein
MSKTKKKTTRKQNVFVSGITIFLLIGLIILFTSTVWLPYFLNPPLPSYTPTSNIGKVFIEKYAKNAEINTGISLHVSSFYSDPASTQPGELISFDVYNNTDEPVVFEDIGFGLRFFTPDENLGDWKEVKIMYIPAKISKIVEANTRSYDIVNDNSYSVNYSDFKVDLPEKIRLFIKGVGQASNKTYVAFVDLLIE